MKNPVPPPGNVLYKLPDEATQATDKARNRRLAWILGITIPVVLIALVVGMFFGIFALLANSDVAKLAVSRAQQNPEMVARLGLPMRHSIWVKGNIETTGSAGKAELTLPLTGPKSAGSLYLKAHKVAGVWKFDELEFRQDGSSIPLDLLADPGTPKVISQ